MGWMTIMAPWRTFPNSKWLFYCLYAKLRREVCQLFVRQINSPNPDLNWGPWTMHPAVEFLFSTLLISVAHLKDHRQCFGKNICSTLLLANGWWPPVQWVSGLTKEHKNINELHCDPEPDSEKLKCLHHFYADNYDSNAKNCYYYWL